MPNKSKFFKINFHNFLNKSFFINRDFCVGLSTIDFCGSKIVGGNKESIGLCGDGKIHYNDNSNSMFALDVNQGEFKFY